MPKDFPLFVDPSKTAALEEAAKDELAAWRKAKGTHEAFESLGDKMTFRPKLEAAWVDLKRVYDRIAKSKQKAFHLWNRSRNAVVGPAFHDALEAWEARNGYQDKKDIVVVDSQGIRTDRDGNSTESEPAAFFGGFKSVKKSFHLWNESTSESIGTYDHAAEAYDERTEFEDRNELAVVDDAGVIVDRDGEPFADDPIVGFKKSLTKKQVLQRARK